MNIKAIVSMCSLKAAITKKRIKILLENNLLEPNSTSLDNHPQDTELRRTC